jgi:2-furoyl-CoA dehydrogenase large subunit
VLTIEVSFVAVSGGEATWVGQPLPRLEDEALLRGEGRYLDDLDPVPGSCQAAVLRSQLGHARITRLDPGPALELPGVIGVLTGADVAAMSRPFPAGVESPIPYYAAAGQLARYAGEPLAVVVARDRYTAEDALELVEVDYEPLEPVMDPLVAAETPGLVASDRSFSYGDPDGAFARAHLVVREQFTFPRWSATPVECYGVVADWNGAAGTLTAWANFQGPFTLHGVAAAALGLPGSRLRLHTPPDSGGSYGVKASVYSYVVLIGLASMKLGVPVRWVEDRLEHLAASAGATARTTGVEAAFAEDGELLALRYDAFEDVGAYVRAPEPATLYRMHGSLSGAYRVRNVAARNRVVMTNRCPSGLNRGFGGPQLYLALERTMAIAARRLGLDPAELARRNLVPAAELPYRTPTGALYDSGDYAGCLDDVLRLARYDEWREEQARARADGRLVGIGLACIVEPSVSNMGYITLAQPYEERSRGLPKSGNADGARVAIAAHGGVTARIASTPQGQGHRTVAAQVVADALGIAPSEVEVLTDMDTATSAWSVASGAYSSRFSGVCASAVLRAAERVADKARRIAAHLLECAPEDVELTGGKARVAGGAGEVSLRRLAGVAHWNPESLPDGMEPGLEATAYFAAPNLAPPDAEDRVASSALHGFIVDVAVVEVERETGEVRVLDYATVHDAGRLLNPLLADGQMRGGFAHGAGAALFERTVYDDDGNLLTSSFMDYLCPTAPDLPPLRSGQRETPSPFTPLGAKGLGEGNTMSAPAALANAVADALGRDDVELPLTPPRVWALLPEAGS